MHDIGTGVARLNRDVQGRVVTGTASGTAHYLPIVVERRSCTSAVSLSIIDALDVISTGEQRLQGMLPAAVVDRIVTVSCCDEALL